MAEAEAAKPETSPSVRMISQYIKDMSFENIAMQNNKVPQKTPKFEMNLFIQPKQLEGDNFEVAVNVKIKATDGDDTVFVIDLDHAGRFILNDVPEEQRHAFLMIECPRVLFPYVRRTVSDVTRDGGFLPLHLDDINFVKMYRDNLERARAQAAAQQKQ